MHNVLDSRTKTGWGLFPTRSVCVLLDAALQQALLCFMVSAFCNNQLDRAVFQKIVFIEVNMGMFRGFILCQRKAYTC